MPLFYYILIFSVLESFIAFAGGLFAIFNEEKVRKFAHFIVSFAIGAFLSVAFIELIPEAAEIIELGTAMRWVLGGILVFFILEKALFWYHCHGETCPVHTYTHLILVGDFLHNFIDGVILTLAFLVDVKLGMITALAIVTHEIPQEMTDFALLIQGGFSRKKALLYNYLSATSIIFGALLTYVAGNLLEPILPYGLALIAGNFIYLATSDLLPELHETTGFWHGFAQVTFIIAGALLVHAPELIL